MAGSTTRRAFVTQAAAAACACAACPLLERFARGAAPSRERVIDVGAVTDFAKDAIVDRWAASHGFFLVVRGGRISAVSSTCTHKKVRLVAGKGGDAALKCPRHGSTFDTTGRVTKSPARKSLPRFGIRIDHARRVLVNYSDTRGSSIELNLASPDPDAPGMDPRPESHLP